MDFHQESIQQTLMKRGVTRRDFLKFCGVMAAALALPKSAAAQIEGALAAGKRTPVIWLEMQDCAGCSEAFLRASHPTAAEVVLDVLSVDYHETIMAAAGKQAEEAKQATIQAGGYLLVVEGSISLADDGGYCCIGGSHRWTCSTKLRATPSRWWQWATAPPLAAFPRQDPTPPRRSG